MIGERLKHTFAGNDAWILSYREECFEQIGLKPSIKIPVFNGSLECEFRKYALFDGRMKEFRAEKREMAQKHRFKKEREFKKRLDEQEANEEGDIRSFSFHKHDIGDLGFSKERTGRNDGDERRTGRNERGGMRFGRGDREERGFGRFDRSKRDERGGKRFERGSKRFDRSDKRGGLGKKNRRFDDED